LIELSVRPIVAAMTGSRRPSPAGSISQKVVRARVAEHVAARERALRGAAEHDPADDGAPEVMPVLRDGRCQARLVTAIDGW
jgi:hypothetical protein